MKKKKRKRIIRPLSIKDLVTASGFTRVYLSGLVKKGMPHGTKKNPRGGKRLLMFSREESFGWMVKHGIVPKTALADAVNADRKAQAAGKKTQAPAAGQVEIDQAMLNQPGILGSLERLRLKEYNLSQMILRREYWGRQNPQVSIQHEIAALEKTHTQQLVALRHQEFAALEYRRHIGELVKYEGMVKEWDRVTIAFRNAILGVPSAVTPELRKYLHDPDTMPEVSKIIDKAVRQALAGLPATTPGGCGDPGTKPGRPAAKSHG